MKLFLCVRWRYWGLLPFLSGLQQMDKSLPTLNMLSILNKPPDTNPLYIHITSPVDQSRFALCKSYSPRKLGNNYGSTFSHGKILTTTICNKKHEYSTVSLSINPQIVQSATKVTSVSSRFNFWLSFRKTNPSFIYWRLSWNTEARLRAQQGHVRLLTNYSSSCCVRPTAVSLESWALNFPSVWVTGEQRGDTGSIRTRTQSTWNHPVSSNCRAAEPAVWNLQLQSNPHCCLLARTVRAAGDQSCRYRCAPSTDMEKWEPCVFKLRFYFLLYCSCYFCCMWFLWLWFYSWTY